MTHRHPEADGRARRTSCSSAKEISVATSSSPPTGRDRRARPGAARLPLRLRREPGRRRHPDRDQGRDRHEGGPTTAGSKMLESYVPVYDATVTARCKARGLRAARQDQHRRVRDGLVDRELRVRAVAQPMGPDARAGRLGRRQRGRGRRPASRRGRSAPTPAARSSSRRRSAATSACVRRTARSRRYGVVAFASSLDQVGPVAKNVRDCALLYSIISGRDENDSTTVDVPRGRAAAARDGPEGRAHRRAEGAERGRRDRARRARRRARGDRARGVARRGGRGVLAAALGRLRPRLLLPGRPGRGVVEPRALRRGPLRAALAGRRLPRDGDEHARTTASATSRSAASCSARTRSRPATTTRTTRRRSRCAP